MEAASHVRHSRTRGSGTHDSRLHSRNKHWVGGESGQRSGSSTPYHSDGERWERGGHRGGRGTRGVSRGGRGKFSNLSFRVSSTSQNERTEPSREGSTIDDHMEDAASENLEEFIEPEEPLLETPEEREKFYQEVYFLFC